MQDRFNLSDTKKKKKKKKGERENLMWSICVQIYNKKWAWNISKVFNQQLLSVATYFCFPVYQHSLKEKKKTANSDEDRWLFFFTPGQHTSSLHNMFLDFSCLPLFTVTHSYSFFFFFWWWPVTPSPLSSFDLEVLRSRLPLPFSSLFLTEPWPWLSRIGCLFTVARRPGTCVKVAAKYGLTLQ